MTGVQTCALPISLSIDTNVEKEISLQLNTKLNETYYIDGKSKYFVVKGSGLSASGDASYISCFNGAVKNSSAIPDFVVKANDSDLILVWDIAGLTSSLGDNLVISKVNGENIISFELKAVGNTVLKDINFYSETGAEKKYSELSFLSSSSSSEEGSYVLSIAMYNYTTKARGAIKYKPYGDFSFLELISSSFSTNDVKGYEIGRAHV